MEREANYLAVGSFVLLVLVMGVLFVYWYSDSREHHDYARYEIYFDGSISGLRSWNVASRDWPIGYGPPDPTA